MHTAELPANDDIGTVTAFRGDVYSLSFTTRLLHGVLFGAVLTLGTKAEFNTVLGFLPLLSAALTCGMAIGTAADQIVRRRFHLKAASVLSATCGMIAIGFQLTRQDTSYLLLAVSFSGIAVAGDWSFSMVAARQALPTPQRWRGLVGYSLAFSTGILLTILATTAEFQYQLLYVACVGLFMSSLVFCLRPPLVLKRPIVFHGTGQPDDGVPPLNAEFSTNAGSSFESPSTDTESEECDETECCGGKARDFQPTNFRHGVVISTVGYLSLVVVFFIFAAPAFQTNQPWTAVMAAFGFTMGHLLVMTTAPRAGYAVATIPFLVLATPVALATAIVPITSVWFAVCGLMLGLFGGGIAAGCSSIVGEQFSDCSTDKKRSRLVVMSLFSCSLILLGEFTLCHFQIDHRSLLMLSSLTFVVGVLAVRTIPTPLISSLGNDGDVADDDEELTDIINALKT